MRRALILLAAIGFLLTASIYAGNVGENAIFGVPLFAAVIAQLVIEATGRSRFIPWACVGGAAYASAFSAYEWWTLRRVCGTPADPATELMYYDTCNFGMGDPVAALIWAVYISAFTIPAALGLTAVAALARARIRRRPFRPYPAIGVLESVVAVVLGYATAPSGWPSLNAGLAACWLLAIGGVVALNRYLSRREPVRAADEPG